MTDKSNGGSAFPRHRIEHYYASDSMDSDRAELRSEHPGMSLRDYFARGAMDSAIRHALALRENQIAPTAFDFDRVAVTCYEMADAMLRAREVKR